MVTYTIYLKELSATSTWQDVTHAVVQSKDIPIRKGFGSLSDGIDVGSLSLTIHMETLQDAALLHVSQKQVLVQADGVTIFEGVSYDDADIDVEERSDYVFTKLKFKPYSALFKEAKVPEDTVWMDKKICDPSDTGNSLVHLLFNMIIDNLPGDLPNILSALFNVSTAITNAKTLALVMLEAGESVEEYLTELLYQNGYAYWMELYTAIVVEPYATGRTPTVNIPITSVVANPDISQAPYVDEKKCVVRLGKIEEYTDEVVYELNKERDEKTGEPTQVEKLEPGDYYPTDSDEAPSELEADYETERENDDIELVYAEGLSYDYVARQNIPDDPESKETIPAYIVFGTHELNPTQATFQLYNNLAVNVSLRNIRVLAQTAYYRNWAEKYYDESTTATEEDETDGIWMPDAATARAFVSRYRAELKAQATHVSFQTHVALQPNTLFTITGLPYQLLVRYVTKLEEDFYEYECVAYSVDTISVGTRIRVAPKKTAQDGFSPVPVHLYALGDETAPFDTSTVVSDGTSVVSDGINRLGVSSDWTLERPTPTAGQYVWQIIGYYTPPATWPTVWSEPVRLTGDKGDAGANGADGVDGTDGTSIVFKGSYASHPENPENGWAYYNTTDGKSYVYQSGAWYQMTIDGSDGVNGQDGDDGISIVWKGESADPPADPEVNWVYRDTDNGLVYIYNGIAWELMVQDGSDGAPGADGSDGASVEVEYSSDGVNWHDNYVSGDIYLRQRVGDGEWSAAIKFVGDDGVDYTGIELLVSPQQVYYSDRGAIRTQGIQLTAILHNLAGSASFSLDGHGVLENILDAYGDPIPNVKYLNLAGDSEADPPVDPVPYDNSVMTVTINLSGYSKSFTIVKVREGVPTPLYLGALSDVPDSSYVTDDGPLILDDHFLYIGEYVGLNPEHDPNNPDNTEEETEAARDLSAAVSESGEYIPGRMYKWNGDEWVESRDSTHLSHAYYDALRLARLSGTWLYAAVVVAQLGLFMELLVTKLSSPNIARDALGRLTDGFVIDGINRLIETYSLKAWNAEIYGFLESKGFRTLIGGDAQNVDTYIVPKSIYAFNWIRSQLQLGTYSMLGWVVNGSFEGFLFTHGITNAGEGITLARHNRENEDISAGETHYFSALYPSKHFGSTFNCTATGYYVGVASHRYHGKEGNPTETELPESYLRVFTKTLGASENYFRIRHNSTAWFGTKSSWAEHSVKTVQSFYDYSLVLLNIDPSWNNEKDTRDAILGSKLVSYDYSSFLLSASHPVSIGSYDQDSYEVKKYVSGTDFYDMFSAIPVGANGFATGKIKYSPPGGSDIPTEYSVIRLSKTNNAIILTLSGGSTLTIQKFIDGTSIGVYKHLEISEQIQYRPTVSGLETQHVMPWGFEGDYPTDGIFPYTIGSKDSLERPLRFAEGWFGTLDVLYDLTLRHLKLNGSIQPLGASCDLGDTVNKLRNAHFSGAVNAATLATSGNASVGGNQTVSGTLTVTGNLIENSTAQWALGSQTINYSASYVLPRGVYQFYKRSAGVTILLEVKDASTWHAVRDVFLGGGYVASDGTNMRLLNNSEDTNCTVYWRKKP